MSNGLWTVDGPLNVMRTGQGATGMDAAGRGHAIVWMGMAWGGAMP